MCLPVWFRLIVVAWVGIASLGGGDLAFAASEEPLVIERLVAEYCLDCHSREEPMSELDLETALSQLRERPGLGERQRVIAESAEVWERVTRKLRAGQMPPMDAEQPASPLVKQVISELELNLDDYAARHPRPGRTATFRRLTRFEYQNAIRDLLAVEVDASSLLPADELSHGFDNITVGELSPALLNRYVSAAQQISRLALGRTSSSPTGRTIRIAPDVTQEERVAGLPPGTRGGTLIRHTFSQGGEYELSVRLARDRNEHVEGLREPHQLEVTLNSKQVALFTVRPPRGKRNSTTSPDWEQPTHANVDRHLKIRFDAPAGTHQVGVTFLKKPSSLLETRRQPLNVHFNMYRHPRLSPAIYQVSIVGPFQPQGPGETASRRRVFVRYPKTPDEEMACAREIIANLARRAYRRPVTAADLQQPLALYRTTRASEGFEAGIEMALSFLLISPEFLFRVERDPEGVAPQSAYKLSSLELASRLSFFLWSSLPDEQLLRLAEQDELQEPAVLRAQVQRMLADSRAEALVTNFAGQWLYLRNLNSLTPDARLFPDFDDNLRQAMRRETELFVESVIREDRSVLDFLRADYTFLNERLAKHYQIPHVYGTRFRRVSLSPSSHRGGLLRQASILSVTSYATRTSPVIRGKWILENILGTPPPPPPPDVPTLTENAVSAKLPVRQRLAQHRADEACATCHNLIDPAGFALENFDAVGRWRELENEQPIDASGGLPDGRQFRGVDSLELGLLDKPELFVSTLTEKLLTYALGRGIQPSDGSAVRKIVRQAHESNYRFSSIIEGIVFSTPFQMRVTQ